MCVCRGGGSFDWWWTVDTGWCQVILLPGWTPVPSHNRSPREVPVQSQCPGSKSSPRSDSRTPKSQARQATGGIIRRVADKLLPHGLRPYTGSVPTSVSGLLDFSSPAAPRPRTYVEGLVMGGVILGPPGRRALLAEGPLGGALESPPGTVCQGGVWGRWDSSSFSHAKPGGAHDARALLHPIDGLWHSTPFFYKSLCCGSITS